MSFTIVGTSYRNLFRFEKEGLYLELLERPDFDSEESLGTPPFYAWLEKQIAAGRNLGEMVRASDFPGNSSMGTPQEGSIDQWRTLDRHVATLIARRAARAIRVVYVD